MAVEEGKRYAKGTCAFSLDSDEPTTCAFPAPVVSGHVASIVELFDLTNSDTNHIAMDGIPVGRFTSELESAAEALCIHWNHVTLRRYRIYEQRWLQKQIQEYKASADAAKARR